MIRPARPIPPPETSWLQEERRRKSTLDNAKCRTVPSHLLARRLRAENQGFGTALCCPPKRRFSSCAPPAPGGPVKLRLAEKVEEALNSGGPNQESPATT